MTRGGRSPEDCSPGSRGRVWTVLFRVALMVYPREWRNRYRDEATEAFAGGLIRRQRESGFVSAQRYALRAVVDAIAAGWRERLWRCRPKAVVSNRATWRGTIIDGWDSDFRNGWRYLRRRTGASMAVFATIALAVAATTIVFCVVNGVLLKPLPFPDSEELVRLYQTSAELAQTPNMALREQADRLPLSVRVFNDWQADGVLLTQNAETGVWTGTVPLRPGEHQYMFVIDGAEWIPDPDAHAQVDDGFGQTNSVIVVGPRGVIRS